ncbi:hypothetical protein D3C72_1609910 [compost metagenome]
MPAISCQRRLPFLNPICLLSLLASCPWEDAPAGEGGRAYPLWQEGPGVIGSGADELSGRCVAIAAKHQGSSAGIWAQEWRIRALVLCRRIGSWASDDIPCFGCKPRPLRGGPGGTMLARHRIHLRALAPGKGLGKVRREIGRGYGSFGSEGATRLPSLLFAQVWGRGERGRLHGRQRSGGNDWGRALDTEDGLDPGPCRGPGAEQ